MFLRNHKNLRIVFTHSRFRSSSLGLWHEDLTTEKKMRIEKHWKDKVLSNQRSQNQNESFYVLSMFPYPSGHLHMGHVRVYSISDTLARFHRLNGKYVIHPMGWDSFGLPAENAAIERKINPDVWTKNNITTMKQQLMSLGCDFDWQSELSTCNKDYYKWTQYIFLKLFEHGLVYRKKALVNWDPIDKTVLADEQVDLNGYSWRSGAKVERKMLEQWFIRTTMFAESLYTGLNDSILDSWGDIINMQRHWIGKCNGVTVRFITTKEGIPYNEFGSLDIWSSEPVSYINAEFIVLSPNHVLNMTSLVAQETTSYKLLSLSALNPISGKLIPIFVSEHVPFPQGRDEYLGCPSLNMKDYEFVINFKLPVNIGGVQHFTQKELEEKSEFVLRIAKEKNVGGYKTSSHLKDWLISRQRYWGTPIPIIHCKYCGAVPVPISDLPVQLPFVQEVSLQKISLSQNHDWVHCACPKCGKNASRETDTIDTFVDSSWYFLRYLDPKNENIPFDHKKIEKFIPVNVYIGGKEHAVLHLYYARFVSHFFNSIGWIKEKEPFKRLLVQGMVMGQSYCVKSNGKYLPASEIEVIDKNNDLAVEKSSGEMVEIKWEKMSKSKHNGVNPEELISSYGCDSTRLFMLADVTPTSHRHWSEATFPGVLNWQNRIWKTMSNFISVRNQHKGTLTVSKDEFKIQEQKLWEHKNYSISTVTYNYKYSNNLSVAISRMQGLSTALRKCHEDVVVASKEFELALGSLIIMLSPMAPHFASELWCGLQEAKNRIDLENKFNWNADVLQQIWPKVDENYELSLVCKVNGSDRMKMKFYPRDIATLSQCRALELMLNEKAVTKHLKNGIAETVLDTYPGCGAILKIFTNQSVKKKINESN